MSADDSTAYAHLAWPAPGPHYVDALIGMLAGIQFREREALYDALAPHFRGLDRARFRRIFALYRSCRVRP